MKKLQLTILSLLFLPLLTFSQDFWEKINIPSGYTFSSVAVGDDGTIYLGSFRTNDTGWVFFSGNDGASWDTLRIVYHSINSLALNHEGNLLIGTSGDIYLYNLTQQSLDVVHSTVTNIGTLMPGPSNSFFATGNTFNRSYDDGYTWEETINMEQDAIYSVAVKSIDTIYIGTINFQGGGGVFRSIDGGDTWQNIGMQDWWIACIAMNSSGDLFAGSVGHKIYNLSGFYRLPSGMDTWDTLSYWPRIRAMIVTGEDVIYCGYWLTDENHGGVMVSSDIGETWTIDTSGMGDVGISKLVLGNNETLYALSSTFPPSKLFRSVLPVSVNLPLSHIKRYDSFCTPNPFNSETIIRFENPGNKQLTFSIYSQSGNIILSRSLTNNETDQKKIVFNRNNLQSGMYFYTISGKGYTCSGKFIIIN